MPESPWPEIPIDAALAAVMRAVAPLPSVRMPFTQAGGHVLAEALRAGGPMPPFAASARDGFAVRALDGLGERRIIGEAAAGPPPDLTVAPGTAARIGTGAPLPTGADAVVMVEHTREADDRVTVERTVASGENVRPVGEDYEAGATLLRAGATIGPAEIGLAASLGATSVSVHPRPRLAVFSTGDELVPPDHVPADGQIRDSNQFAMVAAARAAGAEIVSAGTIRDAEPDVARLAEALAVSDLVITSGGVSMGRRDFVKPWLDAHGEVLFGRVRTKPGKPVTCAVVDGTLVLALPGFPVSTMVAFELLARPAIRRLAGHRQTARPVWLVRLGHGIAHAEDRTEFQRAVVALEDGVPVARTTGFQGSGRLQSLAGANALLRLPEGAGRMPAGATTQAMIIGPVSTAHAAREPGA